MEYIYVSMDFFRFFLKLLDMLLDIFKIPSSLELVLQKSALIPSSLYDSIFFCWEENWTIQSARIDSLSGQTHVPIIAHVQSYYCIILWVPRDPSPSQHSTVTDSPQKSTNLTCGLNNITKWTGIFFSLLCSIRQLDITLYCAAPVLV